MLILRIRKLSGNCKVNNLDKFYSQTSKEVDNQLLKKINMMTECNVHIATGNLMNSLLQDMNQFVETEP